MYISKEKVTSGLINGYRGSGKIGNLILINLCSKSEEKINVKSTSTLYEGIRRVELHIGNRSNLGCKENT